jgi:hypothetical protein
MESLDLRIDIAVENSLLHAEQFSVRVGCGENPLRIDVNKERQ